jgi:hypothetical protein
VWLSVLALATVALVVQGAATHVTPAAAATSGTLTFTPATGLDLSRSTVRTVSSAPKGCPVGTTYLSSTIKQLSRVDGVTPSGKWADGIVGFQVKSAGFSTVNDFSVQLGDTWAGLASFNALTIIAGRYEVTVLCLDQFAQSALGSFVGSVWFTSPTAFQNWNPNGTVPSTTIGISPTSPQAFGTSLTLTATVSPAISGTVQFKDTAAGVTTNVGAAQTVTAGSASLPWAGLAVGAHSITASFVPDDPITYQVSTAAAVPFTIDAAGAPTSTALVATPGATAALGDSVGLTATVTPSTAVGSVQFRTIVGAVTTDLGSPVATSGGVASTSTTNLPWGSQTLTAVFTPTNAAVDAASTSPGVSYTITGAQPTTMSLLSDAAGAVAPGTSVTFTATPTPSSAVGSVTFTETFGGADVVLGTSPVAAGHAAVTTALTGVGTHVVNASFTPTDAGAFTAASAGPVNVAVQVPSVNLGTLALTPATGLDTTRSAITTVTSGADKGCPALTANYTVSVSGPGAWAAGVLAKGSTAIGLGTTRDFTTNLSDTWLGIAQANSLSIEPGKYTLKLRCLDDTNSVEFGFFTGDLWFADATSYLNSDPATTPRPTTISVVDSPSGVSEAGQQVSFVATITPASAVGTVQFMTTDGTTTVPFGAPAIVTGGAATYSVSNLAVGMYTVTATYQPQAGSLFVTSTALDAVVHAVRLPVPPSPSALPTMTGKVVQGSTVICRRGTWGNAPTSYAYKWTRSGVIIAGATSASYRITARDGGRRLACRVYATNAGGTVYRNGASVLVPLTAAPRVVTKPRVTGTPRVGAVLVAGKGTWKPASVIVRYRWLLNGKVIARATGARLRVTSAMRGKYLSCTLVVSRLGSKAAVLSTARVRVR